MSVDLSDTSAVFAPNRAAAAAASQPAHVAEEVGAQTQSAYERAVSDTSPQSVWLRRAHGCRRVPNVMVNFYGR